MKKGLLLALLGIFIGLFQFEEASAQPCLPTYTIACSSNDYIDDFSTTGGVTNITNLNTACNGVLPNNYTIFPMTVSQVQGLSVNFAVQGGPVWSQGFRVFVDWNQDNDFLDAGENVWGSPTQTTAIYNGVINVPATATPGNCKMRVVCRYVTTPATPCDAGSYGEGEEYTFQVIASTPCTVVNGGTAVAAPNPPCPGTNIQLSLTGQTLAGGLTYQWLSSTTSAAGPWAPIPAATTLSYTLPAPLVQTWYRCVVTCGPTTNFDTSSAIGVIPGVYSPYSPCFCPPIYANGGGAENIVDVVLGTLMNNTAAAGNPNPYWVDYTPQQTGPAATLSIPNLLIGQATNASITLGTDPNQFSAVWIDFNHNYIFEAAEYFSSGLNAGANGTATITITPPLTALVGPTRMRVRGGDDVQMTSAQGCAATNSGWGETEDYVVNILAPGPYDPAVTSIIASPSGCIDSNQFVSVGVCNFGSSPINLATNPIVVTLNVDGPNGLTTYVDTIDLGNLGTFCSGSVFALFPNVNLYDGGTYTINTDTLTLIGLTNTNLINDSLAQAITIVNTRPTNNDYNICTNDTIVSPNGLSISNCPTGLVTDSVIIPFNLTFPGNTVTPNPTACATTGAMNFATGVLPNLPAGANILSGEIGVTNLAQTFLSFANQTRFNLSSAANPTAIANIYHQGLQGNAGTNVPNPYNFLSNPSVADLNLIYTGGVPNVPILNMGYWGSSWSCTAPGFTANAGGATQATLKIVYEYVPMGVSWHDAPVGGIKISDSTVLNPLTTPGVTINTSVPGSYGFWGACAADTNCRVEVILTIDGPEWTSVLDTNISCNGTCDGVISGAATGGVGTLTYTLNPGAISNTTGYFPGLCPNTYTLTVADSVGCSQDSIITITEPSALVLTTDSTLDVNCFGDSTGAIYMSVTGGTPGYVFSIAPDPQGQGATISGTFNNLPAGNYIVTVTDTNGCVISNNGTMVNGPVNALSVVVDSTTDISCNGAGDGIIYTTTTSGTPAYMYSINPSGTSIAPGDYGSLNAGVHTITVTDTNGCIDSATATIIEPTAVVLTQDSVMDVSCNGGSDGAIYTNAAGGVGGYTYGILPVTGTQVMGSFTNLTAQAYTVWVSDVNGCGDSIYYTITEPSALVLTTDSTTNVNCFGDASGQICVSAAGGTPGYSYSITPALGVQSGGCFSGLLAGSYTMTVTDTNGCTDTNVVVITEPASALMIDSVQSVTPSCVPGMDGQITMFTSGGTQPDSVGIGGLLGSFQLGDVFSGLNGGSYVLTVKDQNGCTDTMTYLLTTPNAPTIVSSSSTNVLCNGDTTGSATLVATGGSGTITYYLTPGVDSNPTGIFTGLSAGPYTITARDTLQCSVLATFTITEPTAVSTLIDSSQNVLCNGDSNGIIYSSMSGGTPGLGYTYTISPVLGTQAPNGTFSNLPVGPYVITGTDSNGCSDTAMVTIIAPNAVAINLDSSNNILCFGANTGAIHTSATGGTPGYTYSIDPMAGTQVGGSFTGLGAGIYTIYVTDTNGCIDSVVVTLTAPTAALNIDSIVAVSPSCSPGCDGSLTVYASGGTPVYGYSSVMGGPYQVSNVLSPLCASTYTVEVEDANGCLDTMSYILTAPNSPTITTNTSTDVLCNGDSTGSATVVATGGTGPLVYTIAPIPPNMTQTAGAFGNLPADNYVITVTDSLSCSITVNLMVSEPTAVVTVIDSTQDVLCAGDSNGIIYSSASGGTPGTTGYTYTISPVLGTQVGTTGTFTNLPTGPYVITSTDSNGCMDTAMISIVAPNALVLNIDSTQDVLCAGDTNGIIYASQTGGTMGYVYTIAPSAGTQVGGTFSNLPADTYTVTVTDTNGCSSVDSVVITAPSALVIDSVTSVTPSCVPGGDGSMTVHASGGTPSYMYNNGTLVAPGQVDSVFTNQGATTYLMTVTDANGCIDTMSYTLAPPNSPSITSSTSVDVLCNGDNTGSISVIFTGGTPPLVASIAPNNGTQGPAGIFTNLPAANYVITVTDSLQCSVTVNDTVNEPTLLVLSLDSSNNISCNGLMDGAIHTSVMGGTPGYTYSINPTAGTQVGGSFTGLGAGAYVVTATDTNGCIDTIQITLTAPPALSLTIDSSTNVSCAGANDGAIYTTGAGGTLGYAYTINPMNGSLVGNDFLGLSGTTTYTVTLTDTNACADSATVTITEPLGLTFTGANITDVACFGDSTGAVTVTTSGGTGPATFVISPNLGTQAPSGTFTGLPAGPYTITSTDSNNCVASTNIVIGSSTQLVVSTLTQDSVNCNGDATGSITILVTGGAPGAITYNINPSPASNTTGIFNNLSAGIYTLTGTDANSCTIVDSIEVLEPALLVMDSVQITNVSCNGDNDGSVIGYGSGGTGTRTFSLAPAMGNAANTTGLFVNLTAQNYVMTITDANGCMTTSNVLITEPLPLTHTASSTDVLCFGDVNGTITITPSGGTAGYSVNLQPANLTIPVPLNDSAVFDPLPAANNYVAYITDANGCTDTSAVITITTPPQLVWTNISSTDVQCYGASTGSITVVAAGGTGAITYSLTPANGTQTTPGFFENLPSTTYTVIGTDANGCTLSTTIFIDQNPQIIFTNIQSTEPLCFGDETATIDFVASGGVGAIQYVLTGPNGLVGGPNGTTSYGNLAQGIYTITAIDALGCQQDSIYEITGPARISFTEFVPERSICLDQADGRLTVQATGGRGSVYTYTLEPGFNINTTGLFRDLEAGTYTLTVLDSARCSIDTVVTIDVPLNPMQVNITIEGLGCYGRGNEGTADAVVVQNSGTPPYSFLWNTTPAQTTSKALGLYYGLYTVDVMDGNGCLVRDTIEIEPGPCCSEVFLPNAFSPNDDGKNDIFRALSTAGMEMKQFDVFNRWGIRVFQTNTARKGWDGKYKGELVEPGTYYFVFRYKCLTDDKEYTKKGDVIVVR